MISKNPGDFSKANHDKPIPLIEKAQVCWSRGHEVGLKVLSIKPEDEARLTQFVSSLI